MVEHAEGPSAAAPPLWSGLPLLDRYLGPLPPGRISVLDHRPPAQGLDLLWCYGLQATAWGRVVYVDGGNSADPLALRQRAVALGRPWPEVAQRFQLSRAFTAHQLTTVLSQRLGAYLGPSSGEALGLEPDAPPAPEGPGRYGRPAVLLVVAEPLALFSDEDVGEGEAVALVRQAVRGVASAAAAARVPALLSVRQGQGRREQRLQGRVWEVAHRVMQLRARQRRRGGQLQYVLSVRGSAVVPLRFAQRPPWQRSLDEFLQVPLEAGEKWT